MQLRTPLAIASVLGTAVGLLAYARFRREMAQIQAAAEAGGMVAQTAAGPIEFAESGDGEPLLMIHGAGGGYDQGLLIGRDLGPGFRIIAPSRFGYLGTPTPEDISPATQAEAHAALLDHLEIERCIVAGASAGAPSAIEFALRYPGRTTALILLVPRAYDPTDAVGVDEHPQSQLVLRLIERSADFLFWLAIKVARGAVVRFMGVPPELDRQATADDRARVTEVLRSVLPLSRRVRGIAVDSEARVGPWPLEQIAVPTLIVSAEDDLFRTLPAARFTARHIPGCELKVLESGGHLMLGQGGQIRSWIIDFLARSRKPRERTAPHPPALRYTADGAAT